MTMRYSPVNWLIVDWGHNGVAFNDCGLPQPAPCTPHDPDRPDPCIRIPVQDAIDTYDWERWLPEIMVGIEDPDEEIAANYARQAAIQFARQTRVLQREITLPLQRGECVYPVLPFEGEQIIGVLGAAIDDQPGCLCENYCSMRMPNGLAFTFDVARNEIRLESHTGDCCAGAKLLRVLVWSAPTEDACAHDVFLYDQYRYQITLAARRDYVMAVHFRDRALVQSLPSAGQIESERMLAKSKSTRRHSWSHNSPGSGMWGNPVVRGIRPR